jgi:hypothetical protein
MAKALEFLNNLVDRGVEFPDALALTTARFKVRSSQLVEAYDAQYAY